MAVTVAIANHKGGVGKTATALNLGAVLAECGHRVLLVDLDPQASLTNACGVVSATGESMAEVLSGKLPFYAVILEIAPDLHLAPADIALAGREVRLYQQPAGESVLKKALAEIALNYDIVLIDCPPGLGTMTINALVAADRVIIPIKPNGADLRGLSLFKDTVNQVKAINPELAILGILPTFFDSRYRLHQDVLASIEAAKLPVIPVRIGRSVKVEEAMTASEPIITYDPENPQAANYRKLGEGIDQWLRKRTKATST